MSILAWRAVGPKKSTISSTTAATLVGRRCRSWTRAKRRKSLETSMSRWHSFCKSWTRSWRRRAFAARAVAAAIATIATVTAVGAARRRSGFARLAASLFTQQSFARQLDAVLVVNGDHLHLQLVANLDDVFHLIDKLVVQLA